MEQWEVAGSAFLGGSKVAEQLRSRPWNQTAMGNVSTWPASLKTALGISLNASTPMFCIWGEQRILFYNDACIDQWPELSASLALGQSLRAAVPSALQGLLAAVEPVFATGQPAKPQSHQNGQTEAWSASPIWDEAGQLGGVFVNGRPIAPSASELPDLDSPVCELQLQTLANSLSILLAYVDHERRYRFVNQTYTDWFGMQPEAIIGQPVEAVIGEAAYQAVKSDIDQVLSGQKLSSERAVCFKSIGWRHVQRSLVPDIDAETGAVKGYYALINDVTDYRRIEDSLHEREEDLQLVTDALPVLIAVIDDQERYRFVNQTCETWFGLSPALVRQRSIREVVGEAGYEKIRPYVERALAGQPVEFEQEIPFPSGGTRYVEATYVPRIDAKGDTKGFVALVRDISDRKRQEVERQRIEVERTQALIAMQESEARFRNIADFSPIMIWMAAPDGASTWFNQQWYEFTGQTPAEALGDGWLAALHPADAEPIHQLCTQAQQNREAVRLEYRLRHQDGNYYWVLDSAIPRFNDDGEYLGYIGSIIDIHDRKQAETERERLLLELAAERSRLEAVLAQMPEGVMIADAASDSLILSNARTQQIFRHEYELGAPLPCYATQVPFQAIQSTGAPYTPDECPLARSLRHGEVVSHEAVKLQFDDGSETIIEVSSSPIVDKQGQIRSAVAVFQDVSDRRQAEAALRQSEERARLAIKVGRLGTWQYDLQTDEVSFDERMREIWGVDDSSTRLHLARVIGRIHPSDREQVGGAVMAALAPTSSGIFEAEYRIRWNDGTVRWVTANGQTLFAGEGSARRAVSFLGTVLDITDRKQAEATLQMQEQRYRYIFDAVNVPIFEEDFTQAKAALDQLKAAGVEDFRQYFETHPEFVQETMGLVQIRNINQAAIRMFEATDKAELLTSLSRLMVEETRETFQEELLAIAAEARFYEAETVVQTLRGKRLQVLVSITFPTVGPQDRVLVSLLDVTQLKQSEAALRHSQERLRIALQNAPVAVFNQDCDLRYTWLYNPALHDPAEVLGKRDRDFLLPEDAAILTTIKQRVLDTGISAHEEVKITKGGTDYYFDLTLEPLYDSHGTISGITGSSVNISASKRVAIELQESEERLRLAMEGGQMATWDVNLLTGKAIWSKQHFAILGYDPEAGIEASEQIWVNSIHPADRTRVIEEWQQASRENRYYRAEYRVIRADTGAVCWVEGLGNFQYNEQGQAVRSIGVLFDINDRKQSEIQRLQSEMALREQRTILETILRQAADAIIVCDASGQLTFVNHQAKSLAQLDVDMPTEEIDLLAWGTAYDQEGSLIPLEDYCISKALRGEVIKAYESRMVRQDGSYYDILTSAAPLWNERQEIIGAVGSFVDISDRKQAEEALRESEARFRHLADSAPMLVWMSGTDKRCHYFNQTWLTFTGRSLDQEMGNGWIEGVHPQDRDRCLATYGTAFDARRKFEMEYRLRRQDGEYRWILDVGVPRLTPEGEFLGYIGSCVDIHDRKQVEADLQASEERFRNLADHISQFAWMTDETGWIFWYNQRWFDYTGTTFEQMAGWGWQAVHHPDHVDRVVERFQQSLATGEPWEDIFPLRGQDGQYRWFLSRALPIRDETGKILRWFGTNTDITERQEAEAVLAQREAELRLVTNAVPALISFVDAEQRYRFNNYRYEEWFGQAPETTYGKHLWEVLGDMAYAEIRPYVEQVLAGQEVTYESQIPYREGGVRYIAATYVPRLNDTGEVVGFVALVSDISDRKRDEAQRKRAEAALRQSEERLRMAQQAAGAGLWDWDMVNDQLTWSEEYYNLYGLPTSIVPSYDNWIGSIDEADQARVIQSVHEAVGYCKNLNVEFRIAHPVDGLRWIAAIGQTFPDATGRPIRMTGIALNITEQKRFEEALINSESLAKAKAEELSAIMETTPAGIWLAEDPECLKMTANQTAYELMRMAPGAQVMPPTPDGEDGPPFKVRSNGETVLPADLPMQKAARIGQPVTSELEFVFTDGTVSYLYGKAVPLFGPDQAVRGAIGGFVDITALKRSEQERERLLQRERQAREQAENASRIKDEFLAILSHELRSPLNPILGWSSLLRQGRLNAERTTMAIETIERNAKLQIQLIDDLLDISRIIRGKLRLTMVPTNLGTTIRAAIETVRLAAEAKNISIRTQFEDAVGEVLGDSGRLQQVVWNLLSNAVKFTPDGGQVLITLTRIDSSSQPLGAADGGEPFVPWAEIQVSDNGKGIEADFLPHVFEYFRQADSTTTRNFGGLGLGLAIVRYLVEMHGGTVHAHSPGLDQGATFTVRLPLRQGKERSHDEAEAVRQIPAVGLLQSTRILVVDDDLDTRDFITFALEEQGAEVVMMSSAQAALTALNETKFDIIVSDIGMPEMDGYRLIRWVRRQTSAPNAETPAIALTAYAAEGDRDRVLAAGFQRHIAKPVELDKLLQAITQLTQATA